MRKCFTMLLLVFASLAGYAQVTTGTLAGTVKDSNGEALEGATIIVTYLPAHASYNTLSGADGRYTIPHLHVGGPYQLKVTFVGYNTLVVNGLKVTLGTIVKLDIVLTDDHRLLYAVTVNASQGDLISPENIGTSSLITHREIEDFPSTSGTYLDYARFTPQANLIRGQNDITPLAISFGGQNNKYNLFSIDGVKAVNTFDLYSGGSALNPVPLRSVQALQILLSPYDVVHGRFLGADINVLTKSGTNDFHGSAYGNAQNQRLFDQSNPAGVNRVFGAELGGPIIKDKLFFYADVENTANTSTIGYVPGQSGSGSKFDPAVLQGLIGYVQKTYNFDIGSYSNDGRTSGSTSALGRLDWNINSKNKLTFRNSFVAGQNVALNRSPTNLVFSNAGTNINTTTNSAVAELNSSFANHSSNVLRASYNYVYNGRGTAAFPSVTVNSAGLIYNLGGNNAAAANSFVQKDFNLVDYLTVYKGRHTFTFGTDDELMGLRTTNLPYFDGSYVYNSVTAFENNAKPVNYSVGYSTHGPNDKAPAFMRGGEFSVYAQDVLALGLRLRLIYGVRMDAPAFFNAPPDNPAFNSSAISGTNDVTTDKVPRFKPVISPRLGFNWDILGDQTTQLRGGAGIFTGDIPYFWIANQYLNTGVNSIQFSGVPAGFTLVYNPNQPHLGAYIPPNAALAPTEIDVTDPNFKLPQQLHANLAFDRKLPLKFVGTFEVLYAKTISDVFYQNLNLPTPQNTLSLGNVLRPYYNFKYLDHSYADVIELTNTNKGHAYDFTWRLKRLLSNGWSAMAAYTYGHSYSVNDGAGATSIGNWRTAYNVNGSNSPDESNSNFDLGSRVISYFSKTFADFPVGWLATIGLIYSGQTGERYSYLYNYSISGDGVTNRYTATNLVYIPTDASQFVAFERQTVVGLQTIMPNQQYKDLEAFLADNPDLAKYSGRNTPRNGFTLPWENHIDLHFDETLTSDGNRRLTAGLSIVNLTNLLHTNWGRAYIAYNQAYSLFNVVAFTADPKFTFDKSQLNLIDGHLRPYAIDAFNSIWRAQLEFYYSF